jgi:hypothetical protein
MAPDPSCLHSQANEGSIREIMVWDFSQLQVLFISPQRVPGKDRYIKNSALFELMDRKEEIKGIF